MHLMIRLQSALPCLTRPILDIIIGMELKRRRGKLCRRVRGTRGRGAIWDIITDFSMTRWRLEIQGLDENNGPEGIKRESKVGVFCLKRTDET